MRIQKWAVLLAILTSTAVFACKCSHQDIKSSFEAADFVFIAEIYSAGNEFPSVQPNNPNLLSKAKLYKTFKSPLDPNYFTTQEVTLFTSSLDTCDYPFFNNGKYLVFGFLDPDSYFIYSSHCLSTKPLSEVSDTDLALLKRLTAESRIVKEDSKDLQEYLIEILDDQSNRKMNTLILENKGFSTENKYLKYTLALTLLMLVSAFIYLYLRKRR